VEGEIKLKDLENTLNSINSNGPSPNTIKRVFEDMKVGDLKFTDNQILLLQIINTGTSRISTAPEPFSDNLVLKGVP
jgi:hypothetical protein